MTIEFQQTKYGPLVDTRIPPTDKRFFYRQWGEWLNPRSAASSVFGEEVELQGKDALAFCTDR